MKPALPALLFLGLLALAAAAEPAPPPPMARGRIDVEGGIVQIAASRDGVVRAVLVEEGDLVVRGQILARQDDEAPRLALSVAEAECAQAQAALAPASLRRDAAERERTRQQSLRAKGASTEQQLAQARDAAEQLAAEWTALSAQATAAEARVALARFEVEQRIIRAPLDGRIVRRLTKPGEGASTLNVTPLFWFIPEPGRIVRAELDERFAGQIRVGQSASIGLEVDEARRFPARVTRVGWVFGPRRPNPDDPAERTDARVVECVLSLDAPALLVGQRVLVRFDVPAR